VNDDSYPLGFSPQIDPDNNLRLEKGPTVDDQRHRFSFAGNFDLPYGISFSPIFVISSGVPFDILLPDGSSRIPYLQRNAGGNQFHNGRELNAFIAQINAGGGINGDPLPFVRDNLQLGQRFENFDMRLSKVFKINERVNFQAIMEVFNLFNVTNIRGFNNLSYSGFQNVLVRDSEDPNDPGFLRSSTFGNKLQTSGGVFGSGGPRAFQFAVKMNF
jgi:hypothetical protein